MLDRLAFVLAVLCLSAAGVAAQVTAQDFMIRGNSLYSQKNYNSGGVVSEESMSDARQVKVRLFHDAAHPSALYVPLGQLES